ncbi:MAG: DUF3108 domain-containing protein [Bacteroidales bacterium]|nr:DUF3108 domain-containing protein [Bacteroidales bacterium]
MKTHKGKMIAAIALLLTLGSITSNAQVGVSIGTNEKIEYEIYYAFVTGARMTLETELVTENGEELIHLVAKGNTVGLIDKIYNIMEDYESWANKETLLPKRALKNVRESAEYKRYITYQFDHENNTVKSSHSGEHKMEPNCFDMVAACYKVRTMDIANMKPGETIDINTFFGEENWPLHLKYVGTERVKISKKGKINCYKFVPVVEVSGVFTDKQALSMWISADENKIPIRAQMSLVVGSAKLDIVKYEGLPHPLNFN